MFCTKCGAQIPDDSAFCTSCGSAVSQGGQASASPAQQEASTPTVGQMPAADQTPADMGQPVVAGEGAADVAVKRNVPLIVGVAVAAVVVAIVIVVLVVRFAGSSSVKIDEKAFPDIGLRNAISAQADADGDGVLSPEETEGVTELSFEDVADITGLSSSFPNLETLYISGHTIPPLNLADLSRLKTLEVSGDEVPEVNVSGSKTLTSLKVTGEEVSSVNVSNAGSLESLEVEGGSPSVDVSGANSLTSISVPESSQVTGLESIKLVEAWLPVRVSTIRADSETWRTEIERDSSGRMTGIHDGAIYGGAYDSSYAITSNSEYTYDDEGKLVKEDTWYGMPDSKSTDRNVIEYTYDDQGRLLSTLGSADGTSTYEYDAEGRLQAADPVAGRERSYERDDAGQVTSVRFDAADGLSYAYSWTYDEEGRVIGAILPYGTTDSFYTTSISYDDEGRVLSVAPEGSMNVVGVTATYSYDEQGRLSGASGESIYYESARSRSIESEVTYDDRGNVVGIRTEFMDPTHLEPDVVSYELEYQRYFLPADAEIPQDVIVEPTCAAGGDFNLIEPYVIRPSVVRASDALPVALDDQLFQSNNHV